MHVKDSRDHDSDTTLIEFLIFWIFDYVRLEVTPITNIVCIVRNETITEMTMIN